MTKKLVKITGMILAASLLMGACGNGDKKDNQTDGGKVTVLSTGFAGYDFAREVGKDKVDAELLLPPGVECHGYEPAPKDIKRIKDADIFVYVGGESEDWISEILKSAGRKTGNVKLLDAGEIITHEDGDVDEHVWLSLKNAEKCTDKICDAIIKKDPDNKDFYKANASAYKEKLQALDDAYKAMVKNAKRDTIAVGDRFPYMYLVQPYGIRYESAIPGCVGEAEASAASVAHVTDFIKDNHIPVVFHTEMSHDKVCASIAEATGAKSETLYAIHNVTPEDYKKGRTYLDFMKHNLEKLKEALNE